MFVSEKLVFTELHKTAGSHLLRLLETYVGGELVGKHNKIPEYLRKNFVLGSIRNPWDWYVSLWGYGCDQQGSVYYQTVRKTNLKYYWEQLPAEMDRKYPGLATFTKQLLNDVQKDNTGWQEVYQNSSDVEAFRKWIRMMFAPDKALDIGEGYGFSPFSKDAGLLSYRFFKLFTSLDQQLYSSVLDTSADNLKNIWQSHGFVDAFVRQERLEDDFIAALRKAGLPLSEIDIAAIHDGKNNKTNTSSRQSAAIYYDEETANIIRQRERFIIEQFDYRFEDIAS